MDCDEFRRRLLTDPMDSDPELRGHARRCPPCAAEAKQALAFEVALRRELAAAAGRPEGDATTVHGRRRWLLLGLLPLLVALVWWVSQVAPTSFAGRARESLGHMAIAHVQAEPDLLDTAGQPAVPARIATLLLDTLGVDEPPLLDAGPTLRHVGRCRMAKQDGAHLVMDGRRGPVAALVIPASPRARLARVRAGGFEALLLPRGAGAVALVGHQGEPLGALAVRLGLDPRASGMPLWP